MMWLKACPRCRGDLFMERNVGDSYMVCLQCGHVLNSVQEEVLKASVRERERQRPAAVAHAA